MKALSNIPEAHYPYWLMLLWAVLTLPSLGLAPLFDYDETIYAQTAIDMMRHGEWIVPTANGMQFFEKPPFTYYLMDISFTLFGENAFAARLPSALFTLFTVLLIFRFGNRVHSAIFGLSAALIFMTMLEPALLAHAAILDAVLNFFIAGSLLYYFLWRQFGEVKHALITAVMMGAAVSIKGPVGVVVPVLIIMVDRLLARDLTSTLRQIPWLPCIALFLLTATPWYLMILFIHGPGFLYEFIVVHNIGRAMNPMQGHGGGWHYYIVVFIVSVLPWLAWFFWSGKQLYQQDSINIDSGDTLPAIARLGLLWTLIVMVLFTFAQTKLPHYISAIYPGTALLIAAMLFHFGNRDYLPRALYWSTAILLLPVALIITLFPEIYPHITELVRHPRAVAIVSQDISPPSWIASLGVLLLLSLLWLAWQGRKPHGAHIFRFAVVGIVLQSSLIVGLGTFAGNLVQAPTMRIAEVLKQLPEETPIFSYNLNYPSASFYAGRNYEILLNDEGLQKLRRTKQTHAVMMRSESLNSVPFLQGMKPVVDQGGFLLYLITPDSKRAL